MNFLKSKTLTFVILAAIGLAVLGGSIFIINKLYFQKPLLSNQPVYIEYWGLFESEEVMDVLIAKYEKENPNVKINFVQKNFDDNLDTYKRTLYARIGDGSGPAIFRMHSTWSPNYITRLSRLNKSMDVNEFTNRFYDVAKRGCVNGANEVVCIPLMYDGLVLLYNADKFRDAGIFNPVIQSWEDLRSTAVKLSRYDENGELIRSGAALGTANNVENFSDIIALMFFQSGLNIPADLVNEKTITALNFYGTFANSANTNRVWDETYPNSLDAFAAQQTAMVFAKSYQILDILKLNPTLNFQALPVPQLPSLGGGTTSDYISSYWVESVSASAPENVQEESWKFLEWLSRPEQQVERFNKASLYKKFGEPYSHKALKNNLINSPLLGPIVKFAPDARSSLFVDKAGNSEYVSLLRKLMTEVIENGRIDVSYLGPFKESYEKLQQEGLK